MNEIYIVWNTEEDRPAINFDNYGNLMSYTSIQNTQAGMAAQIKDDPSKPFEIIEFNLTPTKVGK